MSSTPADARLTLVAIETGSAPLDGLLYEPADGATRGAVLFLHGNVGNFYTGPSRFLPPFLVRRGFACLAFNRRGHDILVSRVGRTAEGGAFQTASEAQEDNILAARFLAECGYSKPAVAGHSNGGLLAAQFAADHPEALSALVLLSAHAGGRDTYARSCASGLMADGEAARYEQAARSLVSQGRGSELILMPQWWYAISAASLLDRVHNTPDLLAAAPAVNCPALAVRGSLEPAGTYPMEEFAARTAGPATVRVIDAADHWYGGHESRVAELVGEFLETCSGSGVRGSGCPPASPTSLPRRY